MAHSNRTVDVFAFGFTNLDVLRIGDLLEHGEDLQLLVFPRLEVNSALVLEVCELSKGIKLLKLGEGTFLIFNLYGSLFVGFSV